MNSRLIRKICIADRAPLYAAALEAEVLSVNAGASIWLAHSRSALEQRIAASPCDGLILDLGLGGSELGDLLRWLVAVAKALPVLCIAPNVSLVLQRQVRVLGGCGVLGRNAPVEQIRAGIQALLRGDHWFAPQADCRPAIMQTQLSPAQSRVLTALQSGRATKHIARDLCLSEATVKSHLTAIYRKLNVSSRTQAILALQAGQG